MDGITQCIILCGGENSRWRGYQNVGRKHLVQVEGEFLLRRTLRLVAAREAVRAVVVVNANDVGYYAAALPAGTSFYEIEPDVHPKTEAFKFLSSQSLWNPAGRTVVLLGDVWFSDEAMAAILDHPREDWCAFGRVGPSKLTGCAHGELFAHSFTSSVEHRQKLMVLDEMYRNQTCWRLGSGWAHYQLMIGKDPNIHDVGGRFVEIDDFTEDFDSAEDFVAWTVRRPSRNPCPSDHSPSCGSTMLAPSDATRCVSLEQSDVRTFRCPPRR